MKLTVKFADKPEEKIFTKELNFEENWTQTIRTNYWEKDQPKINFINIYQDEIVVVVDRPAIVQPMTDVTGHYRINGTEKK